MKTQKYSFRKMELIKTTLKKGVFMLSVCLSQSNFTFGQGQVYDTFEGKKVLEYIEQSGTLDLKSKNPNPNNIDSTKKCAKYIRNGENKYDYIKMNLSNKLVDISKYATHSIAPAKITMKVYTSAPVGTLIEIQLGNSTKKGYPVGVNSVYQAYSTVSNAWELVEFNFSQIPKGSETSTTQIDQIVLLFNPNTSTSDVYYFDEITGPALASEKAEWKSTSESNNKKTLK